MLNYTPRPHRQEGLLGFLLRVSEGNGYPTPRWLMSYAGLSNNEAISVRPPLDNLANILNLSIKDLTRISYGNESDRAKRSSKFLINNHDLRSVDLDIKRAGVCPQCVNENKYIDVFFSIRIAMLCPHHGVPILRICPSCNTKLTWYRRGLLICKCGHDFSLHHEQEKVSPEAQALMNVLFKKMHHQPLSDKFTKSNAFPLEYFDEISLRSLLCIIEKVRLRANSELQRKKGSDFITLESLEFVAYTFSNWPNNFYKFIESTASKADIKNNTGLTGQFKNFISIFIKDINIPRRDTKFFHKTLQFFGQDYWRRAIVGASSKYIGVKQEVVGITGLAKEISVEVGTAKRLVSKGFIIPVNKEQKQGKLLFDISKRLPRKVKEGRSFGERQAALRLGLPVSVLKKLRDINEIEFWHIGKTLNSFHEFDLQEYNNKLTSMTRLLKIKKDGVISIKDAMNMKVDKTAYKVDLLIAVRKGSLKMVGRLSDTVGSILLIKSEVYSFYRLLRVRETRQFFAKEVAASLGCDHEVIKSLVQQGILLGEKTKRGLVVYEESIKEFNSKYIVCSKVARKLKTSSKVVVEVAKAYNFALIVAERGGNKSPQSFFPVNKLTVFGLNEGSFS